MFSGSDGLCYTDDSHGVMPTSVSSPVSVVGDVRGCRPTMMQQAPLGHLA